MPQSKLYGLVGFFENYAKKATGPSFEIGCGFGWSAFKLNLRNELVDKKLAAIVCDPYSLTPAMTCFGAELNTHLCYLYTLAAHTLQTRSFVSKPVFVTHTEIDIYAEIMMNHRRQKWLEATLQHQIEQYDKLFYVSPYVQQDALQFAKVFPSDEHKKYDLTIRRIMHDFKGNYQQVGSIEEIIEHVQSQS